VKNILKKVRKLVFKVSPDQRNYKK